jgi:hypothetical protein
MIDLRSLSSRAHRSGFIVTAMLFGMWAVLASVDHLFSNNLVLAADNPATTAVHLNQPDAACASCHKAIYEKYEQTGMARGSGIATDALIPGGFDHKLSGVHYDVFNRDGAGWMSFSRSASDTRAGLSGERKLDFYIGSGHRGRTYLYSVGKQWFELPINFYTRRNTWAMAPAFDDATSMPAPLPVDPNCLHCHATDVQPSLLTAKNAYAGAPFLQGGIGCAACHGDPSAHLQHHGHGPISNPSHFSPSQRDSVCIQCHLEGDAVVYRPGRSLAQFVPGTNLSDIAVYFVKASEQTGTHRATSQYEALLHSACKRAAGDKLTCTTCHDPHYDPAAADRVQYFRARCLSCHTNPAMAQHHPGQPDCATCHMPSRDTADISHEQVTDHDIEARPVDRSATRFLHQASEDELVPVGGFPAGDRDYGLAYAQLAARGLPGASDKALEYLTKAAQHGSSDEELEVRLGYLRQLSHDPDGARPAYTATLQSNPYDPIALANLAVLDAGSGQLPQAIHLLDRLVSADPSQTAAGMNLAFIECKLNNPSAALALLEHLETLNPDDPQLEQLRDHGNYGGQHCNLHAEPVSSNPTLHSK